MQTSIRQTLTEMAEPEYQNFSAKLLPGTKNILGVRLPKLRSLAKEIAGEDWRSYLHSALDDTFEEVMLQGMVIGYADAGIDEILKYTAGFVPKIDNWSVCDSFCAGLKITKKYPDKVWEFLKNYLESSSEYELRFGVVMLLWYFIDEEHIDELFPLLDTISHDGYYVKMGVAWAVSICFVKFPEKTFSYLKNTSLDDFTYNKSIQKITESNCVDAETKQKLKAMKRK